MKKRYLFLIPLFAILLVGAFAIGSIKNHPSDSLGTTLEYNSMVCIQTTGDFEGRQTPIGEWELVSQSTNVLYDTGKEAIESYLQAGLGGGDAFDWIELCNSTLVENSCGAPSAGKAEEYLAYTGCGLVGVAGTSGTNAASGNWTVYNEYTSTCDAQTTNVSRLVNDDDDDLAGNSFTEVTLQIGDKLNVSWDIWITALLSLLY